MKHTLRMAALFEQENTDNTQPVDTQAEKKASKPKAQPADKKASKPKTSPPKKEKTNG